MNGVLLEKIGKLIRDPAEVKSVKGQPLSGLVPHIHVEWEIKFFDDRVLLVPPRTVHDSSCPEDGFRGAVLIGEDTLIAPAGDNGRLVRIWRNGRTPAFEKLLDALTALPEDETECRRTLSSTIFRLLKKELEYGGKIAAHPDPVQEAAVFLEKYYYRTDLSVAEIAARMGCTQQYLNRKFKSYSGYPLLRELTRIRLRHARELLLAGNYLIADVARLTGWRNAFYFSRVYRSFYGFPPKETMSRISSGQTTR